MKISLQLQLLKHSASLEGPDLSAEQQQQTSVRVLLLLQMPP